MFYTLFLGLLIGWGVAIPVGPVNLEITRRNLNYGLPYGIAIGLGASTADLVYVILLLSGAIAILQHPELLRIIAIAGSLILFWFGWQAMNLNATAQKPSDHRASVIKCFIYGYTLAALSPFNILFWASLTSQIAAISLNYPKAIYLISLGVLLGTVSWGIGLNLILHITRHKISTTVIRWFNIIGGLILWGFAAYGLMHALL